MDAVALALMAGTAFLTWGVYARLPERMATHFDIHGVADGWMSRSVGAWVLPLVSLGLWSSLRLGARAFPSAWRTSSVDATASLASALVVGSLSALQCLILYAAVENAASIGSALPLLLGGLWIALGLVLPRLRRNPWMGVRTPWTLSSSENWARTHRIAGFAFCIGGALALLCAIPGAAALGIAVLVVSALVPAVYSYVLARRLSGGKA